jgi:hypothetical protein
VAAESLPKVVAALQAHRLERISGKLRESISTHDIRQERRKTRNHGTPSPDLSIIGQFENAVFERMKQLNRKLSAVSYWPESRKEYNEF